MKANGEDWETMAVVRKKELCRCEMCGRECPPEDLRAKKLKYDKNVNMKYMLICCAECNYHICMAEKDENEGFKSLCNKTKEQLEQTDDILKQRAILLEYHTARTELVTAAVVKAVQLNKTSKRAVLDTLFMYPYAEDKDLIWKCREQNLWNSQAYAPIAKERLEELRLIAKEAQRFKKKLKQIDQQSEIYLAPMRYQPNPTLFIITDKNEKEMEEIIQSIKIEISSSVDSVIMEKTQYAGTGLIEILIKDGILI